MSIRKSFNSNAVMYSVALYYVEFTYIEQKKKKSILDVLFYK